MQHRGPDYQSYISFNNIKLGHTRLSIIDLDKRSNQPFIIDNFALIYNGEIYNYKELIKEHKLKMTTQSDTEVVIRMYIKYGSDCLKYFNGMFAFLIYNIRLKTFFVARDRLGIKPLYFWNKGNEWIFSSEIKSIINLVGGEIDEFGKRQYLKLRMTVKNYTIYKDIKFFPPGNYLDKSFKKYWELDINEKENPNDEELSFLIENAVAIRKRSDVPVGSYLSGGLDSTILSFILKPTHTWTVGFKSLNEFDWALIANEELGSNHHQIEVNYQQFKITCAQLIEERMEPLSVPNEVLIFLMTKEVKRKNTVILSGEGADELFWGYDRIFKWAKKAPALDLKEFDRMYCYGSHYDNEVIDFALSGNPGKTVLEKVAYFFQIYHLHGLLRRLDNSTMMCSVEARVPFVDHRLVDMMTGTSFNWRVGKTIKEPLKRIYSGIIPSEIIHRKKIGFPVPLDKIFTSSYKGETPMDKWLHFNLYNLENCL